MKLGVLGLGRRGLFRLEQLRQLSPSTSVIGYDPSPDARAAAQGLLHSCTASQEDFWQSGPFDGLLVTVSPAEQGVVLRDAVSRSAPVALDTSSFTANDLSKVDGQLLVLTASCPADLLATVSLGEIQRARFVSREYGLPGENLDGQLLGALLQLRSLLPHPTEVACLGSSNAAGETIKLSVWLRDAAGRLAELELQRDSLVSERAGWTIEGTQGTLCRQRIYRRLTDGEITDEPHSLPPSPPAKPWWELLQDSQACRDSVTAAIWVAALQSAIKAAATSSGWTAVPSQHKI